MKRFDWTILTDAGHVTFLVLILLLVIGASLGMDTPKVPGPTSHSLKLSQPL